MAARSANSPTTRQGALSPAVRTIVQAARRVVKAAEPKAREIACEGDRPRSKSMMWKLYRYALDDGEMVVGLGAFERHASIFFYRGREIDGFDGVLEGAGKQFRYVTLRSAADAERREVAAIVKKAFRIARNAS